jgi:hypothetical protein
MTELVKTLEKKFVSEDGYDLCISCNKKTKYPTNTSVDMRECYVEGAGQLCGDCYERLK